MQHHDKAALFLVIAMFCATSARADYTLHVVDPPITNHVILTDRPLPPVCREAEVIELYACRGEYEPASFVITTSQTLETVRIEVDPMTGPGGTWPQDAVDVRVVKKIVRGTPAGGPVAMPTLLVYDESFLAIEAAPTEDNPDNITNVARGEIRDAQELQPVTIEGRKQFWVTVHVPKHAQHGTYRTELRIVPANGKTSQVALSVEVYPFDLGPPMLEYSMYYPTYLVDKAPPPDGGFSFGKIEEEQYVAELKNMVAHGLTNPNIFDGVTRREDGSLDFTLLDHLLDLRESVGMRPKALYLVGSPVHFYVRPLTTEERESNHRRVRTLNAWAGQRGYDEVFSMANDEYWGKRLESERDSMISIDEAGGKVFTAVMFSTFFERVGDVLHCPVLLSTLPGYLEVAGRQYGPLESLAHMDEMAKAANFKLLADDERFRKAIDGVHRFGKKIFTYMNPNAGVPLPGLQRRSEGLGLWRVGFDGTMTWAYTHNKGDTVNQSMLHAKVYRTSDGVLDTLHWEGYREGVDDVRYLSTLLSMLVKKSGRFGRDLLLRETYQWISEFDAATGDLDAIRQEMARRIMAIIDLGYRELTPEEELAKLDVDEIEVNTFPEPWRFQHDPNDEGVEKRLFDPAIDDGEWATVRTDQELGWDKQGFAADGYGWYRATVPASETALAKKHRYLYFEAVDEDAWLYLNGTELFENTTETTGLLSGEIWFVPFSVPLAAGDLRGGDLLAVRVLNTEGMGGIWKPVHLVSSDQELEHSQIRALIKLRKEQAR